MNIWKTTKASDGIERKEINVKELTSRLQSLATGCNAEIIQLALQSLLEEIEDENRGFVCIKLE